MPTRELASSMEVPPPPSPLDHRVTASGAFSTRRVGLLRKTSLRGPSPSVRALSQTRSLDHFVSRPSPLDAAARGDYPSARLIHAGTPRVRARGTNRAEQRAQRQSVNRVAGRDRREGGVVGHVTTVNEATWRVAGVVVDPRPAARFTALRSPVRSVGAHTRCCRR